MANNTEIYHTLPNNLLLASVVFKFIAMIIGVFGNVTVIIYTIFLNKKKTAASYLVGNFALADLLVCLTFYPKWIIEFVQILLNIGSDQDFFCKFSRATIWAFMFASIATLLAITVDCYLYIVKPLRYQLIVTHRRVFLAVAGIWIATCSIFIAFYVHVISDRNFRSLCDTPGSANNIHYINEAFGYLFLILILLLNLHIFLVARRQRKRIFAETTIARADNSTEESSNMMSFVRRFFVALKLAKTFAIVVAVLTVCILIPTFVGRMINEFCSDRFLQIWYVVLKYEFYVLNSVVNVFIYGVRHVKYRKGYLHILLKLFSCHKASNWEFHHCWFLSIINLHCKINCKHLKPRSKGNWTNWPGCKNKRKYRSSLCCIIHSSRMALLRQSRQNGPLRDSWPCRLWSTCQAWTVVQKRAETAIRDESKLDDMHGQWSRIGSSFRLT